MDFNATQTDHGGYNEYEGLPVFQNAFARETGVSSALHRRPGLLQTPVFTGNGIQNLHHINQDLPYYSGSAPRNMGAPLRQDQTITQYNVMGPQTENCGCNKPNDSS
jgi:hypothetical protein